MTESPWHKQLFGDEGCSLVWLHGWGHDHKAFLRIADLLKANYRHQLFDLPGFGQTPLIVPAAEKQGADTRDYALALAAQLPAAEKHILIGHSYGARVAVQFAAAYPDRVAGIILVSGAGLKRRRSLVFRLKAAGLRLLGRTARVSDKLFGTGFYSAYAARFGSSDYKKAGALRPVLVSAVNEDLSQIARTIRCPALMIYGSEDKDTPPEIGKKYESLIPVARYCELKGYDHHDILTRGAYQCEALIRTFLKDLGND